PQQARGTITRRSQDETDTRSICVLYFDLRLAGSIVAATTVGKSLWQFNFIGII
ncbi:hypothetical protein ACJX0J_011507, partial [Zea mays]